MLQITVPESSFFDERTDEIITIKETKLCLEHSLVSLQKWESKWHKPFLTKDDKTLEESIDYIRCMTITQNVNPLVYMGLSNKHIEKVNEYIEDPKTASRFNDKNKRPTSREIMTAEVIYYQMIALHIPFECRKWHLNQLLALIKMCDIKNSPPKKMSTREILSRNRALNEARKKRLNTRG